MNILRSYLFLLILLPITSLSNERQVNFIVIDGNSRLSSGEIIDYSGIEIGKIYEQDDIAEVIKVLFSTNLFNDIEIDVRDNTIFLNVSERQIISNINIEGNKLLDKDQIISSLKNIGISQSKPYSKNLIDTAIKEVIIASESSEYKFSIKKVESKSSLKKCILIANSKVTKNNFNQIVTMSKAISNGIKKAKDLGNTPPNICTPTYLSNEALKLKKIYRQTGKRAFRSIHDY